MPQNRLAWEVFEACQFQVRTAGMAGAILSLDYSVWPFVFRMKRVPPEREVEVFEKLQLLERVWVARLNRNTKSSESSPPTPKSRRKG